MNKRAWLILTLWSTVVASIIIFLNLPESKDNLSLYCKDKRNAARQL